MTSVSFYLATTERITFFDSRLSVISTKKGVCIEDGTHRNGGWLLDPAYTYEEVINIIKKSALPHNLKPTLEFL